MDGGERERGRGRKGEEGRERAAQAAAGRETHLICIVGQVIKNPVEAHLPTGARRIGTSKTGKLVKADEWVKTLPSG